MNEAVEINFKLRVKLKKKEEHENFLVRIGSQVIDVITRLRTLLGHIL